MDPKQTKIMPDIAQTQKSQLPSRLEWVGMEKIVFPLTTSELRIVNAEADIFVNVSDPKAKGIHMSRLFLAVDHGLTQAQLTRSRIKEVLSQFIESQKGLSDSSRMVLRWNELYKRKALLSDHQGYKSYPVELVSELIQGNLNISLSFQVFYSSTCPCSSALSRQLFQQAFAKEFCEDTLSFEKVFNWLGQNQVASPHSQRSRADITLHLKDEISDFSVESYINTIEDALKTPVQTAVKREDEQEFARLNGQHPMFVEDALRIMKDALRPLSGVESFTIKTHHYESLHAHDAVGSIRSDG